MENLQNETVEMPHFKENPKNKIPISIEELVLKKQQESRLKSKPVFLSKKQRQENKEKSLADLKAAKLENDLKNNHKVISAKDVFSKLQADHQTKSPFNQYDQGTKFPFNQYDQGHDAGGTDSKRTGLSKSTTRASARDRDSRDSTRPTKKQDGTSVKRNMEMADIKAAYMGTNKEKRKVRKMNDKKFVFDWDAEEDTSSNNRMGIVPVVTAKRSTISDSLQVNLHKKDRVETHWTNKLLEKMTERDWRIFKEDFSISVKGSNIPHPLRSWKESSIPRTILKVINEIGYREPTPIQRQAIPIAIQGRDMIGVAETGSGKTASFVIPMLAFIKDLPRLDHGNSHLGPYALVLAPTRELAIQIDSEATQFAKPMGLICVSIVGGHSVESQTINLLAGAHIIIATPGRLRDLIERRILALSQCVYVVMDEADRMVDLGFEPDLNFILDSMPSTNLKPDSEMAEDGKWLSDRIDSKHPFRQTVMFSATMPPPVERLAKVYLRRPVNVTVGVVGQVVDRIEQRVEMISDEQKKITRLQKIFSCGEFEAPMIVFVNQKKTCDAVARALDKVGFRAAILHGGRSQEQRETALAGLKAGTRDVLIATDVAGRGIDVKNVSLVVNFDMAKNIEDYTHRIGRTGRAGKKGCAITFLANYDTEVYFELKILLQKSPISQIPKELLHHEAALQKPTVKY